jgi:hypothetical protein
VKRGDPDALAAFGVRPHADVSLHNLAVDASCVQIGEAVKSGSALHGTVASATVDPNDGWSTQPGVPEHAA